jgi:hypothetical protein
MADLVSISLKDLLVDLDSLIEQIPASAMVSECAWYHPVAFLEKLAELSSAEQVDHDLSPYTDDDLAARLIEQLDRVRPLLVSIVERTKETR